MILSAHLLVGAAVGVKIHNVWLVAFISVVLHFFFDALPHWEYKTGIENKALSKNKFIPLLAKSALDLAAGIFLFIAFFGNSPNLSTIILGSVASLLPDGLAFLYFLIKTFFNRDTKILRKAFELHQFIHLPTEKNRPLFGAILESSFVFLALFISKI